MALEIKLQLKQMQKLVMTTELRNAIKLLTLSRLELQQLVQEKLLENPCLEEANGDFQEETDEVLAVEREERTASDGSSVGVRVSGGNDDQVELRG